MNTVIYGMGGVGGFFGGKIALHYVGKPNHEVHFIARGEHLKKVQTDGLILKHNNETFAIRPTSASDTADHLKDIDLILLTTKSYDLENVIPQLKKICNTDTVIIPIQNGLSNSHVLGSASLSGILCEGLVYVGSEIESPGVIKTIGALQKIIFGVEGKITDRLKSIETYLSAAGFSVQLTDHPLKYKWLKFQFIGALSAVTAKHNKTVGEVLADQEMRYDFIGIMKEITDVAIKKGIKLPEYSELKSLEIAEKMGYDQTTSFQRDYASDKKHELDAYFGELINEAHLLGLSLPISEKYYQQLKK